MPSTKVGEFIPLVYKCFSLLTDKNCLQIDPKILNCEPVFDDFCGCCQILNPLLNPLLKRSIVSGFR